MRCGICHPSTATGVAETPPFAAEPNHAIQTARTAMDANETPRQNSTIEDVLDAALVLLAMDGDLLSTPDGSDLASLVRFPAFTSTSLPFKNLTEQNLAK